jgi:hypothetical protein
MDRKVALLNGFRESTPFTLDLELNGDEVILRIDEDFAGRRVEEELPIAVLLELATGAPQKNDDLLGLTFETTETEVHGLIGVGSGNERFILSKVELAEALK